MAKKLPGSRPRLAVFETATQSTQAVIRALFKVKMGAALPLLITLLLLAAVLAVISLVPAIAPFVYPLF